ncbi:MAG: hypothetical protein KatS3mg076_3261 [Candidatus Binatia bacterium]|nr:MAG: hypothetical protein KatS3mg076_3261 [Candidatus Binatia bacterium]
MASYFRAFGFEVETASGVSEALDRIRKASFDVVVSDLRLGPEEEEGGIAVLREAQRAGRPILVLLTAYGSNSLRSRARAAGIHLIVDKPVSLETLLFAVRTLLGTGVGRPPGSS